MHHNLQIVILLTPPLSPKYQHYKELLPRLPSVSAALDPLFPFFAAQSSLIASPKLSFCTILFDLMFIFIL